MPAASSTRDDRVPAVVYTALRVLGLVVLALMAVAIVYAGWISLTNWSEIGV